MQDQENITDCYNKTAATYAGRFANELAAKQFDRIYLNAFAERNQAKGHLLDIGCGPGHISRFLYDSGCTHLTGIDLSPGMIDIARQLHPRITFNTADMRALPFNDQSIHAAVALYSIIHLDYPAIENAFREINRVLAPNSEFLFSFHIGNEVINHQEFLNAPVNIDLHLLDTQKMRTITTLSGFDIIEIVERYPYPEIEYQSKRAYVLARKPSR